MRRRPPSFSDDEGSLYSGSESASTCSSTDSSACDEDEVNVRMAPDWCAYRCLIEQRGFRLDTCRDVKLWYQRYWETLIAQGQSVSKDCAGYRRACAGGDEDDLCRDAGLPENLFRGTHVSSDTKVVIKAVHLSSREYDIVRYMSSYPLCKDPRNHLIPIMDFIEVVESNLAFIVMEEWSPNFVPDPPPTLRCFLGALRQCIEHAEFMHSHRIAHLDISIRNLLTDYNSHYAYIDFEVSRRFDDDPDPRIRCCRGTELSPERERGDWADPYKADIWSLSIVILHATSWTGYNLPELRPLLRSMQEENFSVRPNATEVLREFDDIVRRMSDCRLQSGPP
ncbi:kinase-like domain-containing protein [Cristinia sonorae]|uniref:Kinase-like domain-containing protein n=1 Tax=Cristinia sonorae TaxID=1940300 RepID=A0A8K0XU52_9AGAR|nr:kinase-like domain-containing protein [Cristinia sonorae]